MSPVKMQATQHADFFMLMYCSLFQLADGIAT